jgi:hypothetical protein
VLSSFIGQNIVQNIVTVTYFIGFKCAMSSSLLHVLKAWFPRKQCSEVGLRELIKSLVF